MMYALRWLQLDKSIKKGINAYVSVVHGVNIGETPIPLVKGSYRKCTELQTRSQTG